MALVGVTLVLASISIFLCRAQAIATISRLWSEPSREKKEKSQLREGSTLKDRIAGAPNGVQRDLGPQPPASQAKLKPVIDKGTVASTANETAKDEGTLLEADRLKTLEPAWPPKPQEASSSKPRSKMSDAELMPPPPRPTTTRSPRTQLANANALRVPSTDPLPNRGLPTPSSLSRRNILSPNPATTSTLPPSSRPRQKVLLSPGHSVLDWANLTKTSSPQELSGVPYPQRITPFQLARATGRRGKPAWSSYKGRVYNIGPYLPFHPGGEAELMRAAGRDGQALFEEIHAWLNWENILASCLVGFLVSDAEDAMGDGDMEGLD